MSSKKNDRSKGGKIKQARPGLQEDIEYAKRAHSKNRNKKRSRSNEGDDNFVVPKIARKIMTAARDQRRECEDDGLNNITKSFVATRVDDDDDSLSDADSEPVETFESIEKVFYKEIGVGAEDEEAFDSFMNPNPAPRRTLADYIMEKFQEKEGILEQEFSDAGNASEIDPKVIEVYKNAAPLLKTYKSGKFPKLMKFLPTLKDWEQILPYTEPVEWSAGSVYAITRIWVSNLSHDKLKLYYKYLLLPRIRDEIEGNHRLNFHLYQALRKSLYKPKTFVKEFLLPLCASGTCTLREAIIIGSVLARNSIPVQHSMMAMVEIAEMDYTGANSIFLRILFDKKYSLPHTVVAAIISHFLRFMNDKRVLPVLWHQSLLVFVQRYKYEINLLDRCEDLQDVVMKHYHQQISPEVIRELVSAKEMKEEN